MAPTSSLCRIAAPLVLCTIFSAPFYATNARTWVVDNQLSTSSDAGNGTETTPFRTVSKGAASANAGDTVLVHAGVYRERVCPARSGTAAQPITYMAAQGERVFLRGSEVWTAAWNLNASHTGVFSAKLDNTLFVTGNPFQKDLASSKNNIRYPLGQLFVDGAICQDAPDLNVVYSQAMRWYHNKSNDSIWLHLPAGYVPQDHQIEITTRDRVFAPHIRGLSYIVVKGFIIEHCGNQAPAGFWGNCANAQAGMVGCRSGNHWTIENNVIRYAKSIGIDCGGETDACDIEGNQPLPAGVGYHTIRNNIIYDCGTSGIAGYRHSGTMILGNVIYRINAFGQDASIESAGIKFHFYFDGTIDSNLIYDNECSAIWMDNSWANIRVSRNIAINNAGQGIFFEMGQGPALCDNNIVAFTRYQDYAPDPQGDGLYNHDASGITFAHNLSFGNIQYGLLARVVMDRTAQGVKVQCSNIKIINNMLLDNNAGVLHFPFPATWSQNNSEEGTVYSGAKTAFVATTYGGASLSTLQSTWNQRCSPDPFPQYTDRENRSRFSYYGGGSGQQYGATCTPAQWQKFMLMGLHDTLAGISALALAKDSMILSLAYDGSLDNKMFTKVPGVDKDFFGNAMPASPLPGPFQNLSAGAQSIRLWNGAVRLSVRPAMVTVSPGKTTATHSFVRTTNEFIIPATVVARSSAIRICTAQGRLVRTLDVLRSGDLRVNMREYSGNAALVWVVRCVPR